MILLLSSEIFHPLLQNFILHGEVEGVEKGYAERSTGSGLANAQGS